MDRLAYTSVANSIKELDALKLLILSERYSYTQIADWVAEVSWNLESMLTRRQRYNSDEFQCILRGIVQENKKEENRRKRAELEEKDDG
jgi:hypothetical protein